MQARAPLRHRRPASAVSTVRPIGKSLTSACHTEDVGGQRRDAIASPCAHAAMHVRAGDVAGHPCRGPRCACTARCVTRIAALSPALDRLGGTPDAALARSGSGLPMPDAAQRGNARAAAIRRTRTRPYIALSRRVGRLQPMHGPCPRRTPAAGDHLARSEPARPAPRARLDVSESPAPVICCSPTLPPFDCQAVSDSYRDGHARSSRSSRWHSRWPCR